MTRVLIPICLVLLATACGEGGPSIFATTPPVPTTPSPPVPVPSPPIILSGTVYEYTLLGRRALPNVPLDISVEYQSHAPRFTSDSEGHYSFSGASGEQLKVRAEAPGYSQPCRAGTVLNGDTTLNVHLVPDTILSTSGLPALMPIVEPRVSGQVFERTPQGSQPISGARIIGDFTGGLGWAPSATTLTDAFGRYVLCGAEGGIGLELIASKGGYADAVVPVNIRVTMTYDIELVRR